MNKKEIVTERIEFSIQAAKDFMANFADSYMINFANNYESNAPHTADDLNGFYSSLFLSVTSIVTSTLTNLGPESREKALDDMVKKIKRALNECKLEGV